MRFQISSKFLIAVCTTFAVGLMIAVAPSSAQTAAIEAAAPVKKLGFRLSQWKTIHASSPEKAQEEVETLKRIGCEALTQTHGDHVDVRYQCPEWKSIKLSSDELVQQWANWCESKGMETVIMQPPATTPRPTVRFRLTKARTVHLHNQAEGEQIINTLKLVGCQVATHSHGDHMDATFSCPDWLTIELPSEDIAHSWQGWFRESGFETQHTHVQEANNSGAANQSTQR